LAITLWVRRKPTTGLTGLKMAERQLTTNVLDNSGKTLENVAKVREVIHKEHRRTIKDVCNILVCMELKEQVRNDPDFISKVITGDESWIYGYNPDTKQQSSQWKCPSSPRPKKARQVKSNVKSMLICFFDTDGIIHNKFVPPGQTVNAKFYCNVLRWLREDMRQKRPGKWRTNNWVLHHDNAPAHTTLAVRHFSASKNMMVVPRPLTRLI
jgi:hypothetical protein